MSAGDGQQINLGLAAYRSYNGLWRDIDENDYYKLTQRQNIQEDINEKQQGVTPLYLACLRKNTNIMQFLLSNGADPNLMSRNRTPLYLATLYGEDLMVILLLQHGADPNLICNNVAPLHIAAAKGIIELCELLISHGADVNLVAPKAGTPLHVAASRDHRFIFECLLKYNPDFNVVNHHGETVLHMAARLGHMEIVEKLLARRKSINASIKETSEGNTPLHLAAMNKHEKIAKAIAQAFPDLVNIRNDIEDKTPLFYMNQPQRRALREIYAGRRENFLVKAFNTQQALADLIIFAKHGDSSEEDWREIPCHKVVVWARCPQMRKQLVSYTFDDVSRPGTPLSLSGSFDGSGAPQQRAQKIRIDDFSYPVMEALVYYMYADVIRCNRSHIAELQRAAQQYGIERLNTLCEIELGIFSPSANTASNLKNDIATMINNELFSDIQVRIEDGETDDEPHHQMFAHRALLGAASEYFRTMFEISLSERTSPVVKIKQTPPKVLSAVIRWIYGEPITTGQDLTPDTAVDMLELATRFMLDSLAYQVQDYLAKRVDDTNVFDLISVADMLHAHALKEECIDYLTKYANLQKSSEWANLSENIRELVLETGHAMALKPKTKVLPAVVVAAPSESPSAEF
eukprot:TRINITY_DN13646_c0_g1_i1.p1 TRINITY_DN13646_c0_g1~~TRINITY_DN13646_c0_g1_i1.p1  ORF type:complete len:632 (-),score=124.81 TRINITY_DN13646_c0_g1_i1:68-1963(-)